MWPVVNIKPGLALAPKVSAPEHREHPVDRRSDVHARDTFAGDNQCVTARDRRPNDAQSADPSCEATALRQSEANAATVVVEFCALRWSRFALERL